MTDKKIVCIFVFNCVSLSRDWGGGSGMHLKWGQVNPSSRVTICSTTRLLSARNRRPTVLAAPFETPHCMGHVHGNRETA